ncbi:MAG: hypothetical protein WHT06_15845 [Desulfobacterales bacterium]
MSKEDFLMWVIDQFHHGRLQEIVVLLKQMKSSGVTHGEFIDYMDGYFREQRIKAHEFLKRVEIDYYDAKKSYPRCKQCGNAMQLVVVNSNPRNQIGGEWKTMWQCPDMINCGYEELSEKTLEEQFEGLSAVARSVIDDSKELAGSIKPEDNLRRKMRRAAARLGPRMAPPRRRRCAGEEKE